MEGVVAAVNLPQTVRVLLQTVGWRDVLDIVIIAFLVYRLLLLIRGTQAVQLLLGLLVIGALGAVATILRLPVLSFIYQNGGQAILIGVIVLFQPELRRALDEMGRLGRFRPGVVHRDLAELHREIAEIGLAIARLSDARVGALVVLPDATGLEEVAVTGIRLDAVVSAEVLQTIFQPRSALHDGAVLVRDGRVVAAGCVLPLADQVGGVGRIGTRHRAALGCSQTSDALVVVVSEETGSVSLAQAGHLQRGVDGPELARRLALFLGLPASERLHRMRRLRLPGSRPAPVRPVERS
ncbi:MAG TPA: diadenylate cyclase CdaA [Verrucomicrobiae bacterium]|nr:diadenylate cyclase CdaA [Verrucomicrobiae bacterium]